MDYVMAQRSGAFDAHLKGRVFERARARNPRGPGKYGIMLQVSSQVVVTPAISSSCTDHLNIIARRRTVEFPSRYVYVVMRILQLVGQHNTKIKRIRGHDYIV